MPFEHAVAVEQAVIVDADLGVFLVVELAADVNFERHDYLAGLGRRRENRKSRRSVLRESLAYASSTRPAARRTMRSAWAAIAGSCVTMTNSEVLSRRFNVRSRSHDFLAGALDRDCRSARRPAALAGCATSARAMAARCISPPESSRGLCFSRCDRPTRSSNSLRASAMCRRR